MLRIPTDKNELIKFSTELIEQCRASTGERADRCRSIHEVIETGRNSGGQALFNMLYNHLDRVARNLYSPVGLKFDIDFENEYDKNQLDRAAVVARILTRDWERSNTDVVFGRGVFTALEYGASILKQWVQMEGPDKIPVYYKRLVMPWQFGVYREDENELQRQSAMCETTFLTMPEVWRRIYHLPEAEKLYKRIKAHASREQDGDDVSFVHNLISTNQIQTSVGQAPAPGGIVQITSGANAGISTPVNDIDMVRMHELWVQDELDYTTIQIIEPDILIAPLYKKTNLMIPGGINSGLHPYTLIQPNEVQGYIWGRSEVTDLIRPQWLLAEWADDIQRLFGLQIDKIMAFSGVDGLTDERYDNFRNAGWISMENPASKVQDLTPAFPPEAIPMFKLIIEMMNMIGGFPDIMQGKGESGVRAGVHANTLLKTASPRLRDSSLMVERQVASAADLRLSLMEAKDPRDYWTKGDKPEDVDKSRFLLSDIPEDRRVTVNSHSSSPIFSDDNNQLIAFGLKSGFIDGHGAIDNLPFPNKELLHAKLREKEAAQAKMMQELQQRDPEAWAKAVSGRSRSGGH